MAAPGNRRSCREWRTRQPETHCATQHRRSSHRVMLASSCTHGGLKRHRETKCAANSSAPGLENALMARASRNGPAAEKYLPARSSPARDQLILTWRRENGKLSRRHGECQSWRTLCHQGGGEVNSSGRTASRPKTLLARLHPVVRENISASCRRRSRYSNAAKLPPIMSIIILSCIIIGNRGFMRPEAMAHRHAEAARPTPSPRGM